MPDEERNREEEEKETEFKVSDRRRFDESGQVKEEQEGAEKAGEEAGRSSEGRPDGKVEEEKVEDKGEEAGGGEGKKRSLRDRIFGAKEKEGEPLAKEGVPLPEMNFTMFILSLSQSAFIHLGEIPDPISNEKRKDLPMAKQTIDILGMLKEKTKGNLTKDEDGFLESILYDLRMRYVKETR